MHPARGDGREKLYALLEVTLFETLFLVVAWHVLAVLPSRLAGWVSKSFMTALALAAIVAHGRVSEYGLSTKNIRLSLKLSLYIIVFFLGCGFALLSFFLAVGLTRLKRVNS